MEQAACDFNKARLAYNAQLQKGKEMGLDEAAQTEPVRRSENDTRVMVESDTVDATVPTRRVNPFDPNAACDKCVYDVLVSQQFQDYITTAQPTTQTVSAQKSRREGVKKWAFNPGGRVIGRGWQCDRTCGEKKLNFFGPPCHPF